MESVYNLLEKLKIFDNLYDYVRVVDPERKKVLMLEDNHIVETSHVCYAFWNTDMICDNCISIRALHEDKSLIKIERQDGKLMMVTSVPVRLPGGTVVVELLKNVTDSMYITDDANGGNVEIFDVINNLNDLVSRDSLTGVYNRRYVDERLSVELVKLMEDGTPLSVIMADLDFFKNVNDTYGHTAGDEVIRQFAKVLKDSVRGKTDWVARYGGEEFLICMPGAHRDIAFKTAERIRQRVESMDITYKDQSIKITASFGVNTADKNTIENIRDYKYEALVDEADKNLYTAKRTGRNKVV